MSVQKKRGKKAESEAGTGEMAVETAAPKAKASAKQGPKKSAPAKSAPAKPAAPPPSKKAAAPAKKAAAPAKKAPAPAAKKGKAPKKSEPAAAEALEAFAPPPEPEMAPIDAGRDPLEDDDEDELAERIHHTAEVLEAAAAPEAVPLSPEEQELSAIYGDELGGGAIAATEFRDGRTADEDRPMSPEINAREERNKRWDERRRRRRERRDERTGPGPRPATAGGGGGDRPPRPDRGDRPERGPDRDRGGDRPQLDRGGQQLQLPATVPTAVASAPNGNGHSEHVVHRVGNSLGDAAWQVFASLRSSQPIPVKQLAAMMRKRGLLDVDPEQAWPHLKAALIGDERSYRQLGLRPRIVYRGRDLFAPGPVAMSQTSSAEATLASALSQLAVATHTALRDRVGRASPGGFERLVHAYLVSTGYQDIEWVKRVGGISYATALPPDGSSAIMVSARSGDVPVDRRGVGELRVGVEAKQLLAGLLLSARELSEDAERELVRPGRSIMVLCGDAFIGALVGSGVGVVTAAAPVRYVDDQLLDELLAG